MRCFYKEKIQSSNNSLCIRLKLREIGLLEDILRIDTKNEKLESEPQHKGVGRFSSTSKSMGYKKKINKIFIN